jgi:hypothetical protein
VLAAARKHRAYDVSRDLQSDPGPDAVAHRLRLLARLAMRV